ncbi:MAG: hypothetical protein ACH255_15415, partial [Candidatus Thiodiazotropha sp.]
RLKKRHSALLVVHLESPNLSPRALIGAFSGATGPIGLVLTGPNKRAIIILIPVTLRSENQCCQTLAGFRELFSSSP